MGETPLTGDDAAQAKAAAEKAVSGGTVIRVETDSDGIYEAHVRKADGTEVEVKMDKNFKVTSVERVPGPRPRSRWCRRHCRRLDGISDSLRLRSGRLSR